MVECNLYTALMDPSAGIESCVQALQSPEFQDQIGALHVLGTIRERAVCPLLLDVLERAAEEDSAELAGRAIISLAHLNDSRALFPVINYSNIVIELTVEQRVLQYMYYTKDPRARDFLEQYLAQPNALFSDIAQNALSLCRDNADFRYQFQGSEDQRTEAKESAGQIIVTSANLTGAKPVLDEDKKYPHFKPQTYIIGEDGVMLIGGYLNEHVRVARGENVLAAGEVTFSEIESGWKVDYINHRSCGYYPANTCFAWVKKFFERSDVLLGKIGFDEPFPREGYNNPEFLSLFRFGK